MATTTAARAAIVAEARRWLGTPYHHHGRVQGVGVDCAMLLAEVFESVGLVARVEPGTYPHDWHLHRSEERFLSWVERCGARETGTPEPGDVAIFKYGRAYSHGAVLVERDLSVVHAYIGMGVIESRITEEPLAGRPCRYFALLG